MARGLSRRGVWEIGQLATVIKMGAIALLVLVILGAIYTVLYGLEMPF